MKYYSLKNIQSYNALYNVIFGERSNGKTYAVLEHAVRKFWDRGEQLAIIRRWSEDFTGRRGASMFNAVVNTGAVNKITGGEWTDIYYFSARWWLCRYEGEARVTCDTPLAYGFAISSGEHDKSTSYPKVTTILFDEFISRYYIPDEYVQYMNVLSTIIRERNNVKIYMLGNTVNKYCPYFAEMGLKHVKDMKPGTIDLYTYGESGLTVAVEYTAPNARGKKSDIYFAFDNPKLSMITGGAWEIDIYPHCPIKYKPADVAFTYFVQFAGDVLQCEIVYINDTTFTFIHPKTTELKHPDSDIIYSPDYDPRPNWRRRINKPIDNIDRKIAEYYKKDKIFYADNETGEIMRNYLQWCGKVV